MPQKKRIEQILEQFQEIDPDPKTELNFNSPFELLVAVMLSAQATDVSVNKVTPALFGAAPDPDSMIKLGLEKITNHIKTIGLFNSKAKNVLTTSQILTEKYNGFVPATREELEALPGVGKKTAGVVMNVLYQAKTLPVDTHVFRVSNRLGIVKTKTPDSTEKALLKIIPEKFLTNAHHWLILHGRYTCKARRPLCEKCPLTNLCDHYKKVISKQ